MNPSHQNEGRLPPETSKILLHGIKPLIWQHAKTVSSHFNPFIGITCTMCFIYCLYCKSSWEIPPWIEFKEPLELKDTRIVDYTGTLNHISTNHWLQHQERVYVWNSQWNITKRRSAENQFVWKTYSRDRINISLLFYLYIHTVKNHKLSQLKS